MSAVNVGSSSRPGTITIDPTLADSESTPHLYPGWALEAFQPLDLRSFLAFVRCGRTVVSLSGQWP